ncbi:MAG: sensor histidine kinase [Bacteroidales bacterium]
MKTIDVKKRTGLYALLFAGLGVFSYLLLMNFTTLGDISNVASSVAFIAFFIFAFNVVGFSTLWLSSWINTRYPRYVGNRWKIGALYLIVALLLLSLNYGILVSAKLLAGSNRPFIFPNGGIRVLILVWLAELVIIGLLLVNRSIQDSLVLQKKTAQLQKENNEARFMALQSQLNPHFLFNSLNTLIAEIEYDPQGAVAFTKSLSYVYRYVLQCQDKRLVMLEEELEFSRSYLFLHKVRLGDCIEWDVQIPAEYLESMLPPLTLQLLVENVIKHNSITYSRPMMIRLRVENGALTVSNTLNGKSCPETSQTGLKNLSNRCKLIMNKDIRVIRKDDLFIVKVPLLYE